MLKGKRLLIAGASLTAFLIVCIWASTYSASYQLCQSERAEGQGEAKKNDLRYQIADFFVCDGVTLDDNAELLTAVATIAIAVFTLTLWNASLEQGRITKRLPRIEQAGVRRHSAAKIAHTPLENENA